MTVSASQGFYRLAVDGVDVSDASSDAGFGLRPQLDQIVVSTVGHADDKRVEVMVMYSEDDEPERFDRWPGELWRNHMARTEFTVSDVLTLAAADGKTYELTPSGGRFGMAGFARVMADGEWSKKDPQEHHLLAIWPLSADVPRPSRGLPRMRESKQPRRRGAVEVARLLELLDNGITPLVRTDFSDEAGWHRIVAAVTAPVDFGDEDDYGAYTPNIEPIDDSAFAGLTSGALVTAIDEGSAGYALLADREAMSDEVGPSVIYVDLQDEPGRWFRRVAAEVASSSQTCP